MWAEKPFLLGLTPVLKNTETPNKKALEEEFMGFYGNECFNKHVRPLPLRFFNVVSKVVPPKPSSTFTLSRK